MIFLLFVCWPWADVPPPYSVKSILSLLRPILIMLRIIPPEFQDLTTLINFSLLPGNDHYHLPSMCENDLNIKTQPTEQQKLPLLFFSL